MSARNYSESFGITRQFSFSLVLAHLAPYFEIEVEEETISVGETFNSFDNLQTKLKAFEERTHVQLSKRSSRSLAAQRKRAPNRTFNDALQFAEIDYGCVQNIQTTHLMGVLPANPDLLSLNCVVVNVFGSTVLSLSLTPTHSPLHQHEKFIQNSVNRLLVHIKLCSLIIQMFRNFERFPIEMKTIYFLFFGGLKRRVPLQHKKCLILLADYTLIFKTFSKTSSKWHVRTCTPKEVILRYVTSNKTTSWVDSGKINLIWMKANLKFNVYICNIYVSQHKRVYILLTKKIAHTLELKMADTPTYAGRFWNCSLVEDEINFPDNCTANLIFKHLSLQKLTNLDIRLAYFIMWWTQRTFDKQIQIHKN